MKGYTNLEQSKKLAGILPIESADHHYVRKITDFMGKPVDGKWSNPKYGNPNSKHANYMAQNFTSYELTPCWSLVALLEVMPKQLGRYTLTLYWCDDSWCCSYIDDGSEIKETSSANNPVDATVEMIVKLKEKDLLWAYL